LSEKYDKKIIILVIKNYYEILSTFILQCGLSEKLHLRCVDAVGGYVGDMSAIKELNINQAKSSEVYYPLGWYLGNKIKVYPDDFFKSFNIDVQKNNINFECDEYSFIIQKIDKNIEKKSYIYVNLNSATESLDTSILDKLNNENLDMIVMCKWNQKRDINTKKYKKNTIFINEKTLTLKEHLVLINEAGSVVVMDSAIFNLIKSTSLSISRLYVVKRKHYSHNWGKILTQNSIILG
jgi:hypothetical protein